MSRRCLYVGRHCRSADGRCRRVKHRAAVLFLSYANQYTKPFNEISGVIAELQSALASAKRLFEIIDAEPETPDLPNAAVLAHADGSVVLDHVSFSYTPEIKLIEDLNLSVCPGQKIAVVGRTGCGKTTLINLLMRFYDVNAGRIVVSGREIGNLTRDSLRASFGMVLQDTWLKAGSVRDNIAYGRRTRRIMKLSAPRSPRMPTALLSACPTGMTRR